MWSKVYLENVEAVGCGTIAYNPEKDEISPHVHVSVGMKSKSASACTSHLLSARVIFLVEMMIIEVESPEMRRVVNPNLFDIALLKFV